MQEVYMVTSRNLFGQTFIEGIFKTYERAAQYCSNASPWAIDNKGNTVVWRLGETDLVLDIREVIE